MYHCPRCGQPLTEIKRNIWAKQNALMDDWVDGDCKGEPPPDPDESEHWYCTKSDCIFGNRPEDVEKGNRMYFNVHHPFRGPDSKPGDSWSISWVK